jgi:catechol 2,3-dioxygenase-like lactoylglutathione lyase family enzyme
MRDFRDAKTMAKSLRSALAEDGLPVTASRSLELIARSFGADTWNILSARIKQAETPAPRPVSAVNETALPMRIAQIELGCTDLEAAKRYYCDQLGFPLVDAIGDSLFVRCGDVHLIVQRSANPRRGRTVYFSGDGQVHEMTEALKARGVAFTQEPRRIARQHRDVDVWLGFFEDPWGNPLGLLANMPVEA